MKEQRVQIVNVLGLHARASRKFVEVALSFDADVHVSKDGIEAPANSALELLMLVAGPGSYITIRASGADEEQALEALVELVANRFGEET